MHTKDHQAQPPTTHGGMNSAVDSLTERVVFLRRKSVEQRTGLSRSSIYAAVAKNEFPKPVSISAKSVAWVEAEVAAWMREKIIQRA
ncbi:helix-turn-helix transcriptional regulator [Burkholderia gladioli]|uniref:helix-turn-helix transcriptional regulator n=1 Tax=Burkholderia gladioli TaxID=28095 RepID=UPI001FC8BB79|nr:AlpA family transcriptional regulator [Burkholderia gladioli]